MIHIILLILKILGIFLLAVLALLLLITALVVFPAFKYQAEASCAGQTETLKVRVRFSWIFHLVTGSAVYEDGDLTWHVRAAWKHFGDSPESPRRVPEAEEMPDEAPETGETAAETPEPESAADNGMNQENSVTAEPERQEEEQPESETPLSSGGSATPETEERSSVQTKAEGARREPHKEKKAKEGKSFSEKMASFYERMKYTFQKICDNIKALIRKKDRLKAFLTSEIHKSAFAAVLREVRRLLRAMRPRKLHAEVEFGFENPAYTGYVLAGLSMIWPFFEGSTDLRPDFENKVLKGNVGISGRLRVLHVLIPAVKLLLDKNVRITYRHIRKFKL